MASGVNLWADCHGLPCCDVISGGLRLVGSVDQYWLGHVNSQWARSKRPCRGDHYAQWCGYSMVGNWTDEDRRLKGRLDIYTVALRFTAQWKKVGDTHNTHKYIYTQTHWTGSLLPETHHHHKPAVKLHWITPYTHHRLHPQRSQPPELTACVIQSCIQDKDAAAVVCTHSLLTHSYLILTACVCVCVYIHRHMWAEVHVWSGVPAKLILFTYMSHSGGRW